MKLTRCRFELKWQDLWIGVFWKTTYACTDSGKVPFATDVWICLLPCVPLHLKVFHHFTMPFDSEAADANS